MAQKLWEKNVRVNEEIDRFTVGRDREMDLYLAKHDVLGSMAHITMLESIGLLTAGELEMLLAELKNIYASAEKGEFVIEDGIEDVKQRAIYFIAEKLVILLNKNKIVNNMHEAYKLIDTGEYGFGTFISGPSKTADIEQALVMGAHGARDVMVVLI